MEKGFVALAISLRLGVSFVDPLLPKRELIGDPALAVVHPGHPLVQQLPRKLDTDLADVCPIEQPDEECSVGSNRFLCRLVVAVLP
jgi:hypothetical protein